MAKLAGEVKALVVQVKTWTDGHLAASERFVADQHEKVDHLVDQIEKCASAVQVAAELLATGGVVIQQHEKSLASAHTKIRSLRREVYLGFALIFIFLLLTDHGIAMLESLGRLLRMIK